MKKYQILSLVAGLTITGIALMEHSLTVPCCWRLEFIMTGIGGTIILFSAFFVAFIGAIMNLSSEPKYTLPIQGNEDMK